MGSDNNLTQDEIAMIASDITSAQSDITKKQDILNSLYEGLKPYGIDIKDINSSSSTANATKGVKLFEGFFRSKLSDKFPSGTSVERRYGYIYLIIEFVLNSVYNTTGHTQNPKRSIAMIKRAMDLVGIETLDQNYIKESITNLPRRGSEAGTT